MVIGLGIRYVKGRFDATEDATIRRNWRRFANKHGFRYEDAQYYVGFMSHEQNVCRFMV